MCRFASVSSILLLLATPLMNISSAAASAASLGNPNVFDTSQQLRTNSQTHYEVWAADQSNTVPNQTALGARGGRLWIWKDRAVMDQVTSTKKIAAPLSCKPGTNMGPCDFFDIFPGNLVQTNSNGTSTGKTLEDLENVGTWHGIIKDSSNKYVLASLFAKGGGYVGIIDTRTKGAVALFRVTKYSFQGSSPGGDRSVHMTFWSADGLHCIVSNLHGKAIERINIVRDNNGDIINATFDTDASLGLGKNMTVSESATFFAGRNAYGKYLIGGVASNYALAALGDLTPNSKCKENGCNGTVRTEGGRTNNSPVCPIPSSQGDLLYITLSGGGMFIGNTTTTPMTIVAEYGKDIIYGAGCGGVEVGEKMFINSGISAANGANQSYFAIWSFNNSKYSNLVVPLVENEPKPLVVFNDTGDGIPNTSGQLPSNSTRRDSHGIVATRNQNYVHTFDRVQAQAFVIQTSTNAGKFEYSLRDSNVCKIFSVKDDGNLPLNDPAPDLVEATPDGNYLAVALRGPAPVTFPHSTQGSCPGVGIVKLQNGGRTGTLVTVLRTTNLIPDKVSKPLAIPGGVNYIGSERSDIHMVAVIDRKLW